jgi:charged multivesicular body protein 2A
MSFLFGGERPSQNNTLKAYSRELHRHVRHMEREGQQLYMKEKVIGREIKKFAQGNQLHMAQLKAKELIRNRQICKRLQVTQHGLVSLAQQLEIMNSSQKSHEILGKATKILHALNSKMDIKQTYQMLQQFEKENTTMDEKQELVSEVLDGVFEADERDTDDAMCSVFEELGLDTQQLLHKVNKSLLVPKEQDLGYQEDAEVRFAQLSLRRAGENNND